MTQSEKCKKWRKDNPDYTEVASATKRKKYAEDPEHRRMVLRRAALSRHKMTIEQYDAQLLEQHGVCVLCGQPPQKNSLHVDHDHSCCDKKFTCGKCNRGLLCSHCNIKIGYLEAFLGDLTDKHLHLGAAPGTWLYKALTYLDSYKRI